MKKSLIALALSSLAAMAIAGPLPVVDTPSTKTRAEVKAELAEAVRTGDIIRNSEVHMTERELFPGRYEQSAHKEHAGHAEHANHGGKTRAEVKAELEKARKDGSLEALRLQYPG